MALKPRQQHSTPTPKRGKAFLSLPDGAQVLPCISLQQASHVALLSSSGRLLMIDLAELPELNKGKGNKLMQLEAKERIVALCALNLTDVLLVPAGQQQLKLKGDDLAKYVGKRASKGQTLPRGYQKSKYITIA